MPSHDTILYAIVPLCIMAACIVLLALLRSRPRPLDNAAGEGE